MKQRIGVRIMSLFLSRYFSVPCCFQVVSLGTGFSMRLGIFGMEKDLLLGKKGKKNPLKIGSSARTDSDLLRVEEPVSGYWSFNLYNFS